LLLAQHAGSMLSSALQRCWCLMPADYLLLLLLLVLLLLMLHV
jgi:hypothetical protein